ncbi:gluconokinase [Tuberibacillus sp. Marseille-P3662]|uniref:gluconokinase n=1 Tax=Tuberibacillus sp. Marseille-P3662 TaxID=1965358 RepID=UPI000A1C83ED|nr:gluconokinase [Tuberibacillus sp. Marseille-P3662]
MIYTGIDIGTTSTKTTAYDASGSAVAQSEKDYPLLTPETDYAEQDPETIFQAVMQTLTDVSQQVVQQGNTIAAVSFSAAMHSLIGLDANNECLTRSIIWADRRAKWQTQNLKESSAGSTLYHRTGTPIHPMSPLTKLMWFKEEQPELFYKTKKWISIKEYIFYRLFGEFVVDYSIASATGMFNLKNLEWDEEALQIAGIDSGQLSQPVPTTYVVKGLHKDNATQLQIAADTPFIIGANDGVLANLGVGAIRKGVVACTVGTSGAVRAVVDHPITDPNERTFCYALTDELWVIGGPTNNGGIVLQWLRDNIFYDMKKPDDGDPYEAMTALTTSVPPGAEGLLFVPSLAGERSPSWNPDTKGVFYGLTLNHTRAHMIKSAMEGVMLQLYTVVDALQKMGVEPKEFRATGGFTHSPEWLQMAADIFDAPIKIPANPQSACYGATLLAKHALEDQGSIHEYDDIAMGEAIDPDNERTHAYAPVKKRFMEVSRISSDQLSVY